MSKYTREELYKGIEVIFGSAMKFIEQNKDGIIFADSEGTQFQLKVTQKKTKVEPLSNEESVKLIGKNQWEDYLKMTKEEELDYETLRESLKR